MPTWRRSRPLGMQRKEVTSRPSGLPVLRLLRQPTGVCALVGAVFASAALVIAPLPAKDMDAWWIAATGRILATTGHLPRTNFFSFVEPSHPWVMHEALFAVVFYRGVSLLGPAFFSFFGFASASVTAAIILSATLGRARHPPSGAVFAAIVLFGVFPWLDSPRPLYASVALAALLASVAFSARFSWRAAALAVLTELVWVNAHGSFPLGLALLVAGALTEKLDRRRRIAAALVGALATLANPHGAGIYAHVVRYAVDTDATSALIRAKLGGFNPLWRSSPAFIDPLICVAFGSVVLASLAGVRRGSLARAAFALAFALLGALHVRHLVLGVVVGAILVAPLVDARFADSDAATVSAREVRLRLTATLAPALVVGFVAFSLAFRVRARDAWIAPRLGGGPFVRLTEALPPGARVYTSFASTGLLLWLASPRGVRVLYDSRNDCYSSELVAAGFDLDEGNLGKDAMRAILERYGTDYALLPRVAPVAAALAESHDWAASRTDGEWTLFERRAP
jgi:hypothetical protein